LFRKLLQKEDKKINFGQDHLLPTFITLSFVTWRFKSTIQWQSVQPRTRRLRSTRPPSRRLGFFTPLC